MVEGRVFRFETYVLNKDTFELRRDGAPVSVEPQVFDVLTYLVEQRNRVVPKEELLDNVWGNRFVSESALSSRIKSARRAIGDDGRAQRLIKNTHGRGYQFIGEVTEEVIGTTPSISAKPVMAGGTGRSVPQAFTTELSLVVDEEFDFVGRQELTGQAKATASRVAGGGMAAMLIGGEPGIGKTRLAVEIGHRAQRDQGLLGLAGRCDRHLASSLQPWLEALGSYVAGASEERLLADTNGVLGYLSAVFPTLRARLVEAAQSSPVASDEYATLDALVVMIERVTAHTPLLIILDDVQWAGGATRALASLLLRRGMANIFLVLTFRTTVDDFDDTTRDWLADLSTHSNVDRIDLEGLAATDVDALSTQLDVDPTLRAQVWELSEGHTLFATELLRDLRRGFGLSHLPDTVAALVRSRLDRLPDVVSTLVTSAAAIGQEFSLSLATEAAGLSTDAALEAVETAIDAELVHEVSGSIGRLRFSHQLVPAAVLDAMSAARRVRLHARLAEILDAANEPAPSVAHHLLEAFAALDGPSVIQRVRATSAASLIEHQYDTAAGLLARCAELPMDARLHAEVLTELGQAYNAAGRQPQALEPFEQVAALARWNRWPDLLAAAALGRWGESPFRASQDRTVIPLLDEALALGDAIGDITTARLMAKRAAFTLFTRGLDERDRHSAEAEQLVGPQSTEDRLAVLEARWMAIACPAMVHEIVPLDEELTILRKELGALTTDACAPEIGIYWRGDGEALWRLAEELEADPRQRRDVDQWRTTTLSGTEALFVGDFDEARELTDTALPLGWEPWGESGRVVHALVHLLIDVLDGTPEASLQRWAEIAETVPSDNMRATQAWVEAVAGDPELSGAILDDVAPRLDRMSNNFMGGFGLVGFAEATLSLERDDLYPALRAVLGSLSDRMLGHPWAPSLAAADLLCRIDQRIGDQDAAEIHREQAVALYHQLSADTLKARLDSTAL